MSYMNQLASRAPHWWYLSDSNIEWGDDLRAVATYLHEHGQNHVADATLGGFFLLHQYDIHTVDPVEPPPDRPRYIAIGAGYLNGSVVPPERDITNAERLNLFAAYRNRVPEAVFGGGSVYLYRLDQ